MTDEERVSEFRKWRFLVKSNPKKYRIVFHRLARGYVTHSLQEYIKSNLLHSDIYSGAKPGTSFLNEISNVKTWGWSIIVHAPIWKYDKPCNSIHFVGSSL